MAKQAKDLSVVVTLEQAARGEMEEIVEKLKKAGMRVKSSLHGLGMVTGYVVAGKRAALAKISGVQEVEEKAGTERVPSGEMPDQPE